MWLWICASVVAEGKKPTIETRLGVADMEQVLHSYWRTPRVRAELERYKTSEEFRKKQMEVARLERELAGQRFRFFHRSRVSERIREERNELDAMAEKEAERAREREKEAIEELMTDIRRAAESIGREQQLTAIFDSNAPHILYLNPYASAVNDVTDEVIESLNSR
ncbi:MAG: OmpH family outer membrane protein [Candidatus Hydrogenedentota bacterium]|nr:MAG: OmpH family outer membrane protein [Candidatus Hydrogenedentota bacterium]